MVLQWIRDDRDITSINHRYNGMSVTMTKKLTISESEKYIRNYILADRGHKKHLSHPATIAVVLP